MKPNQRDSRTSQYCEIPGGQGECLNLIQRVQAWISPELPKRPNGEEPRRVPQSEKRQRRSGSKSREQPQRHEVIAPGFNV